MTRDVSTIAPPGRAAGLRRCLALAALLAGALSLAGCFDAPKLEDRWTRFDLLGASVTPFQTLTLGSRESLQVSTTLTYRAIQTGYAVAELRASSTLDPASLVVYPTAPRLRMAQDIDSVLAHSVTLGRAIRPVTGWDHLIQHLDFAFSGTIPMVIDSTGGGMGGVFLVCYLGAGQKLELPAGDSIVVTPYPSAPYQLLPIGMTFHTAAGPVAQR